MTSGMVYWVVVTTQSGQLTRRRPHGSQATADEYAAFMKGQFPDHVIEVRPLPTGEFPSESEYH